MTTTEMEEFCELLRNRITTGDPLGLCAELGVSQTEMAALVRDAVGGQYTALEASEIIGKSKVWVHRWANKLSIGKTRESDNIKIFRESDIQQLKNQIPKIRRGPKLRGAALA